jgi:glycogen phosphorylase
MPPVPDPAAQIQMRAFFSMGRLWKDLLPHERFNALGYTIRDLLAHNALQTEERYRRHEVKRAYYLSMEFLMGRSLANNLINLRRLEKSRALLAGLDADLDKLVEMEKDAALGNGGLGRLAACFIDSLATLGMPGFGYGILYEYGLFKQAIRGGQQVEKPDPWMLYGTPWLIERQDEYCLVQLGGEVRHLEENGRRIARWMNTELLVGIPHDMPIVGYGGETVNHLRLFSARASEEFDMSIFNEGDYIRAVERKVLSETVSKVLYPNDQPEMGQRLRLVQEYFLVSCSLQDMMRRTGVNNLRRLHEKAAVHLNDTHPSLAVPELMRLLVDIYQLPWDEAWEITTATLSYTNHTLLPEALEKWPVSLMADLLPRHLEIIYEINQRMLNKVMEKYPGDTDKLRRMSIIEEGSEKNIRMAHLCIAGSHSVNGVAALHSQLICERMVPDFFDFWPEKFNNKTNGVTPRRWLLSANPGLSNLLKEVLGESWITDLEQLSRLEAFTGDEAFIARFADVKHGNKVRMLNRISNGNMMDPVDPNMLVDVQIKRIHEYKRQLLNVLHIVRRYLDIRFHDKYPSQPRLFVFSGKAAPGYHRAKEIIYLIHRVAEVVNADPKASPYLRIIFVPDYSVSVAELLVPAAEISEQISTAGYEASGTGNMKMAMNGALTIGTLDGANIEIREKVGADNFFLFGNQVEDLTLLQENWTHPHLYYSNNDRIRELLDVFQGDLFSPGEYGRFRWVYEALAQHWDPYFHLADLNDYLRAQQEADALYLRPMEWNRKALLNVARMGYFSSDRTIAEYARDIWHIAPLKAV